MQRSFVVLRPLLRVAGPALRPPPPQSIRSVLTRSFITSSPLAVDPRRPVGKIQIVTIDDKLAEFNLDENIDTPEVRIKSEQGSLSDPRDLFHLLDSIDRSTHHVLQLSKPGEHEFAIVRVAKRQDLVKQINDKETASRQAKHAQKEKKPKQIELNWAISGNDLQLKMKQMEDFLRKGKKVELLLAAKRRQRRATVEEGEALLSTIKEKVHEAGAVEFAPMDGGLLRQATIKVKMP